MADGDVPELDLDAIEAELQEMEGQAEGGQAEGGQAEGGEQQALEQQQPKSAAKDTEPATKEAPPPPKRAGAKPAIAAKGKKAAIAAKAAPAKAMDPDLIKAILEADQGQAAPPPAGKKRPAAKPKKATAPKKQPAAAAKPAAQPEEEGQAPEPKPKPKIVRGRAFALFKEEQLPALQGESLGVAALNARMGELWEALQPEQRKTFEERAKAQAKEAKQQGKENVAPAAEAPQGQEQEEEQVPAKKKRGRPPKAAKAAKATKAAKAPLTEQAGGSQQPEGPSAAAKTRAAAAGEESEDEGSDREACDWEAHPAEAILGTTASNQLMVKRKGLDLSEFGLLDAAAIKRQRTQPEPAAPVSLQMLEEWEAWERGFRQSVARSTARGVLDLGDIGQDSPLELCSFLGTLRSGAYPLAHVDKKRDTAARFPVLGLSMVTQRLLDLEKAKRVAAEAEAAALRKRLQQLEPTGALHGSRRGRIAVMVQSIAFEGTAPNAMDFKSRRSPVFGQRGMVACTQPLAAEAGMRVLQQGGNAADAAVAMAAALNVTEPCATGIGGDAFALFFSAKDKSVDAVLGCGRSPAKMTLEHVRSQGIQGLSLPAHSALTVTVPGAPGLWEDVVRTYGKLSLAQVLQPAIELAEGGWPISYTTAVIWEAYLPQIQRQGGLGVKAFTNAEGRAPRAGELHRNSELGATFRAVAERGAYEGYYKGRIAESIVAALRERGSVMELSDLAAHRSTFTQPIRTTYRGYNIYEIPPPTQGIAALMALNVLEQQPELGSSAAWGSADHLHAAIEAMRLGFADALAYDADPEVVHVPQAKLLSKEYAAQRRAASYNPAKAATVRPGDPDKDRPDIGERREGGDTVYFCVVDGEGNACSFINSNYDGFGSGIVPAGCGFTLQNRGHNFILDPAHPNCLAPNKRPYHTIIPGLATDPKGELFATFGVMGGFMQPQGHLQVISNMLDFGMEPQAALDAPRWSLTGVDSCLGPVSVRESAVALEEGFSEEVAQQLRARGHRVTSGVGGFSRARFGRGQIIRRNPATGVLWGGSEPRGDGQVLGW